MSRVVVISDEFATVYRSGDVAVLSVGSVCVVFGDAEVKSGAATSCRVSPSSGPADIGEVRVGVTQRLAGLSGAGPSDDALCDGRIVVLEGGLHERGDIVDKGDKRAGVYHFEDGDSLVARVVVKVATLGRDSAIKHSSCVIGLCGGGKEAGTGIKVLLLVVPVGTNVQTVIAKVNISRFPTASNRLRICWR